MYVNAGGAAIKILQRPLEQLGFPVTIDGVLGPQTVAAAKNAFGVAPDYLVDAYGISRRNYYYSLADNRATSRKYARRKDGGKGDWIKRAEEFITRRFHLSLVEHNQRETAWG